MGCRSRNGEYSKIWNVLLLIMVALIIVSSVSAVDGIVELAHDQGKLSAFLHQTNLGHAVRFSPPQIPWSIQTVRIYGRYFGNIEKQSFSVEIWAANGTTLSSRTFPYDVFKNVFTWTDIETSAVVTGDFQVVVFTGSSSSGAIYVGYDSSQVNQYSDFVTASHATFTNWPVKRSDGTTTVRREEVNWMIRVVGGPPGSFAATSKTLVSTRTDSSSLTSTATKSDSSPLAVGFLDMSRLQQIGGVAATAGAALFGWFFKTRSRRFIGSYLNKIDLTYNQYAVNRVECKKQLEHMKEEIVQLLKKGKLDETQFVLLDNKISEHLKALG